MLDLEFYAPVAFSSSVTARFGIPIFRNKYALFQKGLQKVEVFNKQTTCKLYKIVRAF